MRTKVIWGIVVLSALLAGYIALRHSIVSADKYRELLAQIGRDTPDFKMNYEQLSMLLKERDYVYTNMTVKNNMQRVPVTRRRLKKAGLPTVYYDILRRQIHTTNSFVRRELKSGRIPAEVLDMERMVAEAKTRYFETERQEILDRLEELKQPGGKVKRLVPVHRIGAEDPDRLRFAAPSLPIVDTLSPVVAAPVSVSTVRMDDALAPELSLPSDSVVCRQLFFNRLNERNGLPANRITALAEDAKGYMWIGTSEGLCRFDGYNVQVFSEDVLEHSRSVSRLCKDTDGKLWVAFAVCSEVCCYNETTSSFDWYGRDQLGDSLLRVLDMPPSSQFSCGKWMWHIDAQTQVLCETDSVRGDTLRYAPDIAEMAGIDDPYVQLLYLDSKDILWIGTELGGVFYADVNRRQLIQYRFGPPGTVQAMCRDASGRLYLSVRKRGVVCVAPDRSSWHVIPGLPSGADVQDVTCMLSDNMGRLWLGTADGIIRWDPGQGRVVRYRPPSETGSPTAMQVRDIIEDPEGGIWVGCELGVAAYLEERDVFVRYGTVSLPPVYHIRFTLSKALSHSLWVATSSGLYRMSDASQAILITDKVCTSMDVDMHGFLWLGTPQGLYCITHNGGMMRDLSHAACLWPGAVKSVRCLDSTVWVSNNYGITCLLSDMFMTADNDMESSAKAWYVIQSGNVYAEDACCVDDRTGDLFFGGLSGVDVVSSHRPPLNTYLPHPVIVRNNETEFEFSALHFSVPSVNRYAYRVQSWRAPLRDTVWQVLPLGERQVKLPHLRAGRYRLQMLAANCDGVWNPEPATCEFRVGMRWPAWLTGWRLAFLMAVVLMFCAAAIVILRRYVLKVQQNAVDDWLRRADYHLVADTEDPSSADALPTDSPARTSDAAAVMEQPAGMPELNPDTEFMRRVVNTVIAHMADPEFSVKRLAEELNISRTTLFEMLKKERVSGSRLISEIRLDMAARLIQENPQRPLNEVAICCGFREYSNFWRSFRNRYGVSPSDYAGV